MKDDPLRSQEPRSLARLLNLDREPVSWSPEELGAILRHQLRSPLELDLAGASADERALEDLARTEDASRPMRTFGDVLNHPSAPLELLALVKDFARAAGEKESGLPREVATVLYYLAIAAALARHGERISSLADEALVQGMQWSLRQPWLDETSRAILEKGMKAM